MTAIDELQTLLAELFPFYKTIQQKRSELEDLGTVDHARTEYEQLTAQEERRLTELKKRKDVLKETKRQLNGINEEITERFEPWISSDIGDILHPTEGGSRPSANPLARGQYSNVAAERRKFQKMVNRWQYTWRLEPMLVGQINCIIRNDERPLGEAIAMLDWRLFVDDTLIQESPEERLKRLIQWLVLLKEYDRWLQDEIGVLKTRYHSWLHIWKRWYMRQGNELKQVEWTDFIAEARRARYNESISLENEIEQLTKEIDQLKQGRRRTQ